MDEGRKELAFQTVRSAETYLRKMFGGSTRAWFKLDSSWSSEVDHASESIIINQILKEFPGDGILPEESPEKESKTRFRWIIDPLDGTNNFLRGFYDFGCGLTLEQEGEPVLGICYFPMYNQLFWAENGKGSFMGRKRIMVSNANVLRGGLFVPDSNFRVAGKRSLADIDTLVTAGCSVRIQGCSHRTLMYVASGRVLIAISRSGKPWDLSPGALILKEAGGMATNENGQPWKPGSKELIATNGLVHSLVLTLIRMKNEPA